MWVGSRSLHFLCPKYLRKSPWTFVKSWWLSEWQLSQMGVASSCINKVKWDGETWRSAQWPRTFKRWDNSCVDKVWGEVSQEMRLIKNNGEFSFILSENSKQNHKGTPLHTQWKCLTWKKRQKAANVGEEEQQAGLSSVAGGSVNGSLWKTVFSIYYSWMSTCSVTQQFYSWVHTQQKHVHTFTKRHIRRFTAELFLTVNTSKQPKFKD